MKNDSNSFGLWNISALSDLHDIVWNGRMHCFPTAGQPATNWHGNATNRKHFYIHVVFIHNRHNDQTITAILHFQIINILCNLNAKVSYWLSSTTKLFKIRKTKEWTATMLPQQQPYLFACGIFYEVQKPTRTAFAHFRCGARAHEAEAGASNQGSSLSWPDMQQCAPLTFESLGFYARPAPVSWLCCSSSCVYFSSCCFCFGCCWKLRYLGICF